MCVGGTVTSVARGRVSGWTAFSGRDGHLSVDRNSTFDFKLSCGFQDGVNHHRLLDALLSCTLVRDGWISAVRIVLTNATSTARSATNSVEPIVGCDKCADYDIGVCRGVRLVFYEKSCYVRCVSSAVSKAPKSVHKLCGCVSTCRYRFDVVQDLSTTPSFKIAAFGFARRPSTPHSTFF